MGRFTDDASAGTFSDDMSVAISEEQLAILDDKLPELDEWAVRGPGLRGIAARRQRLKMERQDDDE